MADLSQVASVGANHLDRNLEVKVGRSSDDHLGWIYLSKTNFRDRSGATGKCARVSHPRSGCIGVSTGRSCGLGCGRPRIGPGPSDTTVNSVGELNDEIGSCERPAVVVFDLHEAPIPGNGVGNNIEQRVVKGHTSRPSERCADPLLLEALDHSCVPAGGDRGSVPLAVGGA